ncbi:hypothetical protein JCM18899A_48360 [Nocardioides sp. AN3]
MYRFGLSVRCDRHQLKRIVFLSKVHIGRSERAATVAVLPVGSFEQHGRHLPLGTDTLVACAIANAIAERYDVLPLPLPLPLPPITISCSNEHADFAGTVSISATTLFQVVRYVQASLEQRGVRKLVLVNGHGGNDVLSNVVQEANVGCGEWRCSPAATRGRRRGRPWAWSPITTRTCTAASSKRRSCCTTRRTSFGRASTTRIMSLATDRISSPAA